MKKAFLLFIIPAIFIIVYLNTNYRSSNQVLRDQLNDYISTPINIPYSKMDKKNCYAFMDSTKINCHVKLVFYHDSIECIDCTYKRNLRYINENKALLNNVRIISIYRINSENSDAVYHKLCNLRVSSEVFFDTCGIFRGVNPKIPQNKLYHTFVLNKNNRIIFVGSPVNNNETERIFKKVIQQYAKVS